MYRNENHQQVIELPADDFLFQLYINTDKTSIWFNGCFRVRLVAECTRLRRESEMHSLDF